MKSCETGRPLLVLWTGHVKQLALFTEKELRGLMRTDYVRSLYNVTLRITLWKVFYFVDMKISKHIITSGCTEIPRPIVDTTTWWIPARSQPIKIVIYPGGGGVGNIRTNLKHNKNHKYFLKEWLGEKSYISLRRIERLTGFAYN